MINNIGGSSSGRQLYVIDEIGKMELFSSNFVKCVQSLFKPASSKPRPPLSSPPPGFEQEGGGDSVVVLATIPIARQRSHWLVEELRHREDCLLFEVRKKLIHTTENFMWMMYFQNLSFCR